MCGIAGVCLKSASKEELNRVVERMNRMQERRGPDDDGVFVDGENGVALGHRRLSILDLTKAGHQPMSFGDSWIVFNGEIYNFPELKRNLEAKGRRFKTKTDTEVILALYAEHGEKSFEMLRGMFAFVLWDGAKRKLFLVRDRYGIKPLYYYGDERKVVFASTVKAIAESGLIPNAKNAKAFIGFLLFGSVPLPATTIKGVFAVPAGHYLIQGIDGSRKLVKYHDSVMAFGEKEAVSFETAAEETRARLEEAVDLHLISDAPLGVFLSGGLDSSAIAALARRSLGEGGSPLITLSVDFEEKEFSERRYQKAVVERIKSDHREVKITKQDFFDSLDEIFEAMDQPTVDGINTFFIAKAAKEAGLKAVLSGLGADEIFLGYSHFRRAAFFRRIQKLPGLLKFPFGALSLLGDRYSKLRYFQKRSVMNFYLGVRGLFSPREAAEILDVSLSEINAFIEELDSSMADDLLAGLSPADLLSCLELKFYLQNQLLKDTDFMSMHHSIEVRVPFLDHPLVEHLSGLPSPLKLGKKMNKPLLVESVRDLLPPEIFTRPKMGFTFPFEKWIESGLKSEISGLRKQHWSRHWAKAVSDRFAL